MSSVLFRISEYVMVEYLYDQIPTPAGISVRRLTNAYTGALTLSWDDLSDMNGRLDTSIIDLPSGKKAVIDKDASYYYPDTDSNISVDAFTYASVNAISVRVHLLSGYDLDGYEGLVCKVSVPTNYNDFNIAYQFWDKSDTRDLYFNPRPIIIEGKIFDRYVQYDIIEPQWLKSQDEAGVYTDIIPVNAFRDDNNVVFSIYMVSEVDTTGGISIITLEEPVVYSTPLQDMFAALNASVLVASDGGSYFEIQGKYGSDSLEDFIYLLNSRAGNNYHAIHELTLTEYYNSGGSRVTSTQTFSQYNNYDTPIKYRPIVEGHNVSTFAIDYTLRIYNASNGLSIIRIGSLISTDIAKYGRYAQCIAVDDRPLMNIYNKITNGLQFPGGLDFTPPVPLIRSINRYVDISTVDITENGTGGDQINLTPFSNTVRFSLRVLDQDSGGFTPFNLGSGDETYKIVFLSDSGQEYKVEANSVERASGIINFIVSSTISRTVKRLGISTYFVIICVNDQESFMFSGPIVYTFPRSVDVATVTRDTTIRTVGGTTEVTPTSTGEGTITRGTRNNTPGASNTMTGG